MEQFETISPTDTAFAESETILPIDEYGLKWGISRRTVDRYIETGRVRGIKKSGRTFCIDNEPKPPMDNSGMAGFSDRQTDANLDLPVKTDWIRFGVMSNQARQASVYKVLTASLTVLIVAIVSISAWWFVKMDRQAIGDGYRIERLQDDLKESIADLAAAEKTITLQAFERSQPKENPSAPQTPYPSEPLPIPAIGG